MHYWLKTTAHPHCAYEGYLQKEEYNSDRFMATLGYFQGQEDFQAPKTWDIYYDKIPCDISSTPFTPLVSEKFKNIVEEMKINAKFHKANVFVDLKPTQLNYYFPEPLEIIDFIDKKSPGVKVVPESGKIYPGWINGYKAHKSQIHYGLIQDLHWVRQLRAFGNPWVISHAFKTEIEKHSLTNFRFHEAHSAD